ncbi:MAG: hypothetical protein A2521_16570 [Deltaproteobacteria bacterium RIFOXYD12_FULL_57_12]|nr:MAG: hypothetical protein A2521_16570 [Deltaproteobacteria bacterium RIFOXYD12_FULL_57_12]
MQAKLTLSLDKELIAQAKEFSRRQHKSLSKMVENYLRQATSPSSLEENSLTPLVKELSGLIKPSQADRHVEEYSDYLAEKYR